MKYITLSDLSEAIRKNIWKIPRDIDFIIGIPRSGTICASIISSYLNVPLIDIDSFLAGLEPCGGLRLDYFTSTHRRTNRVLVIDDTVSSGRAMNEVREKLKSRTDYEYVFMCVYLEGTGKNMVDIYLEDVRKFTDNFTTFVFYEWNIFQHHQHVMKQCLYDFDGVFCPDPPDDKNEAEYLEYIKNAPPLFIPRTRIGGIVTFRIEKNREITEKWLAEQGVQYKHLIMFPAYSREDRNRSGFSPERFKATFYREHSKFQLFVESSAEQAPRIAKISGKPVYCVENNKLYL